MRPPSLHSLWYCHIYSCTAAHSIASYLSTSSDIPQHRHGLVVFFPSIFRTSVHFLGIALRRSLDFGCIKYITINSSNSVECGCLYSHSVPVGDFTNLVRGDYSVESHLQRYGWVSVFRDKMYVDSYVPFFGGLFQRPFLHHVRFQEPAGRLI